MASISIDISTKVKYLLGPFLTLITLESEKKPFHRFLVFWGSMIIAEWDVKNAD